ncbi:MAG: 50S ribosomal protein L21 [Candidatus Hatepunaea meridiana]|nr:50S ribosomal protein L21 [Candidatus Hatepunaea meridiana]
MYAIVKILGRQYCASPDEEIKVDKLKAEPGDDVTITDVIMYAEGENTEIGTPRVPYQVKLEVIEHGRHRKVISRVFKRRGGMRRKLGHRQQYSLVKVKSIDKGE